MADDGNLMTTNNVAEENKSCPVENENTMADSITDYKSNKPEDNSQITMVVEEEGIMVDKKREAEEKRIRITEKKMAAAERKNKKEKAGQDKRNSEEVYQLRELILECIDRYMTKKETAHHLYTSHSVLPACTECAWMTLKEANEEFFAAYNFKLKLCEQIVHFNKLLNDTARPFMQDGASSSVSPPNCPNCDASGTQSTEDSFGHLGNQMSHLDKQAGTINTSGNYGFGHGVSPENLNDYELMEMFRNDSYGSRSFVDDDMAHAYHSGNQRIVANGNLVDDLPNGYHGNLVDALPNGNRSIRVDNNGMLCLPYSEGQEDSVDNIIIPLMEKTRNMSTDDTNL